MVYTKTVIHLSVDESGGYLPRLILFLFIHLLIFFFFFFWGGGRGGGCGWVADVGDGKISRF